MRYSRTLVLAFSDLGSHAFRSFLTALGVIFGVGAVVAMMAISEGASRAALEAIRAMGIDNIEIQSVKPTQISVRQENSNVAVRYGVTDDDIRHIKDVFENVRLVVPVRDARKDIYQNGRRMDVRVFATTADFLDLTRSMMTAGRFLLDRDGVEANPVCVLGAAAARKLFRWEDPIGQKITIGPSPFKVVGVFNNPYEAKLAGGAQLNNYVLIDIRAADALFGKGAKRTVSGTTENVQVEADFLYIRVKDIDRLPNTAQRVSAFMDDAHPNRDIHVVVPLELFRQANEQQNRDRVQFVSIAAISLLVGGIGIMNIMMANIYERTKEIGTRRALGAKRSDILLQFLTEAVMLTAIGGLLGVFVGWGITKIMVMTEYSQFEPIITTVSIVLAAGVSVGLGILFGTYPAWKAANLDPITALRSD